MAEGLHLPLITYFVIMLKLKYDRVLLHMKIPSPNSSLAKRYNG